MVEKKDVKVTVKSEAEPNEPAKDMTEAKSAAGINETVSAGAEAAPAESGVKAAPARKTAAKKASAKTTAKKETVKKETSSKAAVKKEAAAKETSKKEAAPKETAKKAPARKPAAKKAAEPKAAVHFQFDGKEFIAKDLLDQAVKAYKKAHKGVEIKSIDLYIVAHEGAAYYVVNGEGGDDYKIML